MVLSIGEILVDIFVDGNNKTVFPGGAPFNVASNISNFNGDISFYGAVGNDEYGKFLLDFAHKKLDNVYIDKIENRDTTQAIVTLDNGERSFKFVRDNSSDYILDVNNLSKFDLNNVKIVHIGSLMLSYEEGRKFFFEAVKYVHEHSKALVSFDVNYRDDIFSSEKEAKEIFLSALKEADIVKFTEEELELLTSQKNLLEALKSILNDKQVAVVTLGKDGSLFYSKDLYVEVPTYKLTPIDTTGAGDAFYSYFLYAFDKGFDLTNKEEIKNCLLRANIAGGLATQKKGAIDVVPSLDEIEELIKKHNS